MEMANYRAKSTQILAFGHSQAELKLNNNIQV